MMVKTSVYLDAQDKERLTAFARESGTSEAMLLRRGVKLVLAQSARPRPRLAIGASHDGWAARDTDDLLSEAGFGA